MTKYIILPDTTIRTIIIFNNPALPTTNAVQTHLVGATLLNGCGCVTAFAPFGVHCIAHFAVRLC